MNPVSALDMQRTPELVETYIAGEYNFKKSDLPYLLNTMDIENSGSKPSEDDKKEKRPEGSNVFESSLPDHLEGKRAKDMTPEGKKLS